MPDRADRDLLASSFTATIVAHRPLSPSAAKKLAYELVDQIDGIGRAATYRSAQEGLTDPLARELLQQMRDQLLIALIRRAGGSITVPVQEIDRAGDAILTMRVDERAFAFTVEKKN